MPHKDIILSQPVPTAAAQTQITLHNLAAELIKETAWLAAQKKQNAHSKVEEELFNKLIIKKGTHYQHVMGRLLENADGEILC